MKGADGAHNPLQNVQIENNLDPAMKKFREDWPNARTQQEKDAVIKSFTDTFARSEAGLLQYMMLYGRETGYWDALKEANILNALMKDAQKMGGDKDYKVDIGV